MRYNTMHIRISPANSGSRALSCRLSYIRTLRPANSVELPTASHQSNAIAALDDCLLPPWRVGHDIAFIPPHTPPSSRITHTTTKCHLPHLIFSPFRGSCSGNSRIVAPIRCRACGVALAGGFEAGCCAAAATTATTTAAADARDLSLWSCVAACVAVSFAAALDEWAAAATIAVPAAAAIVPTAAATTTTSPAAATADDGRLRVP